MFRDVNNAEYTKALFKTYTRFSTQFRDFDVQTRGFSLNGGVLAPFLQNGIV